MTGLLENPNTWSLTTLGGIPIRLVERSGSFGEEDADMTEVYIIQASRLEDFVLESFPLPIVLNNAIVYGTKRRAPGMLSQITKRIAYEAWTGGKPIDPFDVDSGAANNTYDDFLKLTISYGTSEENDATPDENDPKTFLEISANGSGEFLSTPMTGAAKWEDSQGAKTAVTEINIPATVTQPEVEWSVNWKQIPFTFFNATVLARLRSRLGTINSGVMTTTYGSPAETVLFVSWSMSQQFTWRTGFSGQPPIALSFKFLEKNFISPEGIQVTHNHFFRPGVGWRKLLVDGTRPVYNSSNLDQIFKP